MTIEDLERLEDIARTAAFLPDGWLDDELLDATQATAARLYNAIREQVTLDQLAYLLGQGYTLDRLASLVEEARSALR